MRGRLSCLIFFAMSVAVFPQAADVKAPENSKIGVGKPEKLDKHPPRSVMGAIEDKDGNPIGGAMVYLKDVRTGKVRAIAATPEGKYKFDDLNKTIDYELTAVKGKDKSASKLLSTFDTRRLPVMNLKIEAAPVAAAK